MNLGQMVLVLLSIVLFSTLLLGIYNSLMTQMDFAVRNIYQTQGLKISDAIFQRYESFLIGKRINFENLEDEIRAFESFRFQGVDYSVNITSQVTNRDGVSAIPPTNHLRIDTTTTADLGNRTIHAGNFSKILSRVYDD